MTSEQKRGELLDLILEVSFRREKVVLSSGKESDFYLDLRQTLMRPRGVVLAGELVLESLLAGPAVEAVGGMAVGAVPLVSAVLAAAAQRDPATSLLGLLQESALDFTSASATPAPTAAVFINERLVIFFCPMIASPFSRSLIRSSPRLRAVRSDPPW